MDDPMSLSNLKVNTCTVANTKHRETCANKLILGVTSDWTR